MKYEKWLTHEFSTGGSIGEDFKRFLRDMRSDLKEMAKKNDLELSSFNKNHYCFSAILKDKETGQYVYVSMADVRYRQNWSADVLIRNMRYENDWTGERNHFCEWKDAGIRARELIKQKERIKRQKDKQNDRSR